MKKFRILLTLLIVLLLALPGCGNATPRANVGFTVTFLDVGQADCTIIQSGSSNMIIDAGTNTGAGGLVNTIKSMGIKKFDFVVGTHPHEDHIGGMDAVVKTFDIGAILMPKVSANTKTFEDLLNEVKTKGLKISDYANGSKVAFGESQFTIIAPNSQSYEELNNYSIVIRMTYGKTSFLFAGDAESVSEKEILAGSYALRSTVLKVGHHGSGSSTTEAFLNAVSPQCAVIFVGKDNDYGHPSETTLNRLKSIGVKVFRTDLNGTITFTSDGTTLTYKTEK